MVFRRAGTWPAKATAPAWPQVKPAPAVDYGDVRECGRILNGFILEGKGEREVKEMWEFKRERVGGLEGKGEVTWEGREDLEVREAMRLLGEMTRLELEMGE